MKAKIKGRRVYLKWWRCRWFAVVDGVTGELRAVEAEVLLLLLHLPPLLLFFLFFSSFLFSSLLFSLPSPLCSSLVLFSLFSWSPLFFPGSCFFISPVFIEKQGRDIAGATTVLPPLHRPSNTWKAFGQVGVLGQHLFDAFERKKVGENRGKKNLLLPLPRSSRGRRRPTVPSKRHRFGLFFL